MDCFELIPVDDQNRMDKPTKLDLPDGIPPLRTIYWYITGSCNLNCRHCWINPRYDKKSSIHLALGDIEKIVVEAQELGLRNIKLTGGEPFLHPEILDIFKLFHSYDIKTTMETNGTLIGKKEARAIRENKVWFAISLDGPNDELHDYLRGVKGAFDRTLKALHHINEEGLRFQIICCLHTRNRPYIKEMISFAHSLGAESIKLNVISGMSRSSEMKEKDELLSIQEILQLYNELKELNSKIPVYFDIPPAFKTLSDLKNEKRCSCGIFNILGVLHDGHASICGVGEHVKELDMGNLLTMGLRKIWLENELLQSIRENVPQHLTGICQHCMFKNYCLGKCIALTYYEKGTFTGSFPFCEEALERSRFPLQRTTLSHGKATFRS